MLLLAWIIQIAITTIGVAAMYIFFIAKNQDSLMLLLLITIVFAIVDLCKIPLVHAIYYSKRTLWRFIFLLVLLAICFSEFETLIQFLELGYKNRYIENIPGFESLFIQNIIIIFIAVIAAPTIALIGLRLKDKNK